MAALKGIVWLASYPRSGNTWLRLLLDNLLANGRAAQNINAVSHSHVLDPHTFDIRRDPNDHVGFGGPGSHYCLGANLARRELVIMFDEIFRRMPDLEVCGDPEYLLSYFINSVKHLPVRWSPQSA